MPVAEVSLNELSRRVGLAKPNVMRYFESREAVLLQLLDGFLGSWLVELGDELAAAVDAKATPVTRAEQLAEVLSCTLSERHVLCDLLAAQGGVLERNVSVEVVRRHKRSSQEQLTTMADLVRVHLPEVGDGAEMFCFMGFISAGALSTYVPPPPSLLAAYEAEPDLGEMHLELRDALRTSFTATLVGVLPRP